MSVKNKDKVAIVKQCGIVHFLVVQKLVSKVHGAVPELTEVALVTNVQMFVVTARLATDFVLVNHPGLERHEPRVAVP